MSQVHGDLNDHRYPPLGSELQALVVDRNSLRYLCEECGVEFKPDSRGMMKIGTYWYIINQPLKS